MNRTENSGKPMRIAVGDTLYKSITQASYDLGVDASTLAYYLRNRKKSRQKRNNKVSSLERYNIVEVGYGV